MNADDPNFNPGPDPLERRLAEVPLSKPPEDWRAEILANVLAQSAKPTPNATRVVKSQVRSAGWAGWLRDWFGAVPAEWAAVAALVLLVVGLNWSLFEGLSFGGGVATASAHDSDPVEGVVYLMASRESLMRELGLMDETTRSPMDVPPASPAEKRTRYELNQSGTNAVASGWA